MPQRSAVSCQYGHTARKKGGLGWAGQSEQLLGELLRAHARMLPQLRVLRPQPRVARLQHAEGQACLAHLRDGGARAPRARPAEVGLGLHLLQQRGQQAAAEALQQHGGRHVQQHGAAHALHQPRAQPRHHVQARRACFGPTGLEARGAAGVGREVAQRRVDARGVEVLGGPLAARQQRVEHLQHLGARVVFCADFSPLSSCRD